MYLFEFIEMKFYLDENGIYYSNVNLPGMTKIWQNVNARYGPKPVPTDLEAHAVAATAFVVMTYTQKARVKEAEQSGKFENETNHSNIICLSSSMDSIHA